MFRDAERLAGAATRLAAVVRKRFGVWGVAGLVAALVLYALVLQPLAESRLGLRLPPVVADGSTRGAEPLPGSRPSGGGGAAGRVDRPAEGSRGTQGAAPAAEASDVLRRVGSKVFASPAGLVYTPGSQHGHRLKHLMAHAEDDPDRPGQHGVFDAVTLREVVLLIDDAYERARAGRDTRAEREGERAVYTVNLGRRVGYIGGESGGRRGNPAARHLRLVVQGDRLITAFPVVP